MDNSGGQLGDVRFKVLHELGAVWFGEVEGVVKVATFNGKGVQGNGVAQGVFGKIVEDGLWSTGDLDGMRIGNANRNICQE